MLRINQPLKREKHSNMIPTPNTFLIVNKNDGKIKMIKFDSGGKAVTYMNKKFPPGGDHKKWFRPSVSAGTVNMPCFSCD